VLHEQALLLVQELSSNPASVRRRTLISRQGILHAASGGLAMDICRGACIVHFPLSEICCSFCKLLHDFLCIQGIFTFPYSAANDVQIFLAQRQAE